VKLFSKNQLTPPLERILVVVSYSAYAGGENELDFTVGEGEAVATRIRRNKNENQVTAGIHAD